MKTFVVEHLDPELGPWSALEYAATAKECTDAGAQFCLSSVPLSLDIPTQVTEAPGIKIEHASIETTPSFNKERTCLLDPASLQELSRQDGEKFDVFLFGGILGDDPPRDRTSLLRAKGFHTRRLGPKQMTTDTAVRVTRIVVQDKKELDQIPYIDTPEIKIDEHESTEMPFRYVRGEDGKPVMPEGMIELIKLDSEKGFEDFLDD